MYKKLFTILVILIFLITSISVISAADSNEISVKIIWDDNNVPDYVTVNLIKDGKIIDSKKLTQADSWKTIFKVDEDGDYQVKEIISPSYSSEITGNVENGFIIKNKMVETDVLGTADDTVLEDDNNNQNHLADDNNNQNDGEVDNDKIEELDQPIKTDTNGSDNSTDNNSTDDNSTNNDTSDDTSKDDSNSTDDDSSKKTKTSTKTTTTTKVVKKDDKKPENKTKSKKNNTGFPIAILVVAVFVAAFVPFNRRK